MLYEFIDEEGVVNSYTLLSRPKPIIKKREFRQGDKAPCFAFESANVLWMQDFRPTRQTRLLSCELLHRPLVIAFYNSGWGEYASKLLPKLEALSLATQKAGGTLLVFTQQPIDQLQEFVDSNNISFSIGYDPGNTIARSFGAYDPNYPVWDRIAGISEDVVTPGLFVVNRNETFAYAKLDKDFEMDWNEAASTEALTNLNQKVEISKYA